MLTCCTAMLAKGEFTVPSLFRVGGYLVFFWSNENGEPIHVHVVKGKPCFLYDIAV